MAKQEIDWGPYPAAPTQQDGRRASSWLRAMRSSVAVRFPEWLLVLIILSLPLQVSKSLFPIQQIEFSRLLMGVAFVWMLAVGRSRGWPMPRAMTLGIGLVLALLVSSLVLTRWQSGVLLVLAPVVYAAFATFVAIAVRDRVAVAMVAVAMVVAGAYVAILAVALGIADVYLWRDGVFGTLGRTNATFWDPNIAARFLNITLIVLLAAVTIARLPGRRVGLAIAACVMLFAAAMVLTQSRFGWITAIAMLPLAIAAFRPRRWVIAFSGVFLATFIAVAGLNGTAASRAGELAAGVSHSLGGNDSIDSRGNLIGSESVTYIPPREVLGHALFERLPIDGIRYYLLEAGIAMWQDHPVAGIGVGGFSPYLQGPYREFIPRDRLSAPVTLPHTFLAQFAAEHGLVGLTVLGVFLAVLAGSVVQATRRTKSVFLRSGAVAAGLAITIIFLSSQVAGGFLVEPYLWLAIGMLAAIHRLVRRESTPGTGPAARAEPA
jgi:O-antigen ligase